MARPTLDLDQMRALVAVAETGGFTAAGERLGRTQSAVSMQIRKLEDQIGRRLLDRTPRGVAVTPSGEQVLALARRMLQMHDEAVDHLTGSPASGAVSLGMPDDYAEMILPPLLARFAADHPGIEVNIRCAPSVELIPLLEEGTLDLALLTRHQGDGRGRLVRREPLVWVSAPGFRPEAQDPLPLALFQETCLFRPLITGALEAAGRPYRIAFTGSSIAAVLAVVRSGLAVTALARGSVPPGWRFLGTAEGLPALPVEEIALRTRPSQTAAAKLLARYLLSEMAEAA
jgi:DNA-binding transcriptional LysR family regulator